MNCSISEVKGDIMFANTNVVVLPVSPDGAGNIFMTRRFMNKFPIMRQKYENFCKDNLFSPGKIWIYRTTLGIFCCYPLKTRNRNPSKRRFVSFSKR